MKIGMNVWNLKKSRMFDPKPIKTDIQGRDIWNIYDHECKWKYKCDLQLFHDYYEYYDYELRTTIFGL